MRSERQSGTTLLNGDPDSGSGECWWEEPGTGLRIEFAAEVVRDLKQSAIQAFMSIPRRGVEIGGLLLGELRHGTVFHVAAFKEISCQHSFGPSYNLNEVDRRHLIEAVERDEQGGASSIVG